MKAVTNFQRRGVLRAFLYFSHIV